MSYRHIPLTCQCGESPSRIEEVGFTDDHQIVIHWWCQKCQRVVYASKRLVECWLECPAPDPVDRKPIAPAPAPRRPKLFVVPRTASAGGR